MFNLEGLPGLHRALCGLANPGAVIRVDNGDECFKGERLVSALDPINAVGLVRPVHLKGLKVQLKAAHTANALRFGQLSRVARQRRFSQYALEMLKKAGNQHGVKVHKMIFRDVYIFTSFIDQSGKRHDSRSSREEGSASETWEKYVEACQKFEAEDRDKRLKELHGSEKTGAFVHKHIFGQQ
jgi:hypothetical protein